MSEKKYEKSGDYIISMDGFCDDNESMKSLYVRSFIRKHMVYHIFYDHERETGKSVFNRFTLHIKTLNNFILKSNREYDVTCIQLDCPITVYKLLNDLLLLPVQHRRILLI